MDTLRTDRGNGGVVLTALATRTDGDRLGAPRTTGEEKEKLVEIAWVDSYTDGGWAEYSPETVETKTYGILVGETKEWTTLAMTKEKGYWGNLWYIPTKSVLRIRVIEDFSE